MLTTLTKKLSFIAYHVPHSGLVTSRALFYLIFASTLRGGCYFPPYFTNGQLEVKRS